MGGGDGLALREVFRHPAVKEVTLVDLDPGMTKLADRFPALGQLNENAYHNPKLSVINADGYIWVKKYRPGGKQYDVVIIDFPDPHNYSLGKLYSRQFFKLLRPVLAPGAAVSIQCTSPFMAPRTFWCIVKTMEAAGFTVKPYHVAVPSFYGIWGFALAKMDKDFPTPDKAPTGLKYPDGRPVALKCLNDATMKALFAMPVDLQLPPGTTVEINRLDNQVVVQYHESEWKHRTLKGRGGAAVKEVTYGYWLRQAPELLRLAQERTAQLEEVVGASAFPASAEWDRGYDTLGQPMVTLRLSDFSGSATMVFEPGELENPVRMRSRFNTLWSMLLQIRIDRQMRDLQDPPDAEAG